MDEAVLNVIESTAFINGKPVQEFADNLSAYLGVKHVIPCANGTDALQIAMMALDLQPGDEVITPSFTYIATTEVIALLRLTPFLLKWIQKHFAWIRQHWKKQLLQKQKPSFRFIFMVMQRHMEEIMAIAKKHNLIVIEDNAQAIGGDYTFQRWQNKENRNHWYILELLLFSLQKILGAYGDGGAIFTNDDALADKMKMIANHGQRKRYYHEIVGCNSRLDTIQAAVLNIKLKHLDEYIKARQAVADFYDKAFANNPKITTPYRASYCSHVFHQYTLLLE